MYDQMVSNKCGCDAKRQMEKINRTDYINDAIVKGAVAGALGGLAASLGPVTAAVAGALGVGSGIAGYLDSLGKPDNPCTTAQRNMSAAGIIGGMLAIGLNFRGAAAQIRGITGKFRGWWTGRDGVGGGGASGETVKLYRAVSETEYQQISRTGTFAEGPNSLEGKWFAERLEHAQQWGRKFYPDGKFRIVEASVLKERANTFFRIEKLDGIGPARYSELESLNEALVSVTEAKP